MNSNANIVFNAYEILCNIVKHCFYKDASNFLIAVNQHGLLSIMEVKKVKNGCGICGYEIDNNFWTGYCSACTDICPGCKVPEEECFGISPDCIAYDPENVEGSLYDYVHYKLDRGDKI